MHHHPILPLAIRMNADTSVTGRGVTIAMVDSDFVDHPDLSNPESRITRYVDAVRKTDSAELPGEPLARHWHGTMTACSAAGNGFLSNGMYSSLAPNACVVAIRTMDEKGRVATDTIAWALAWISNHADEYNIRVVNISVYADEVDHTLDHPVNAAVHDLVNKGIVVVAATGNNPNAPIRPPAAAPLAISVGGLHDHNSADETLHTLYHSTFGRTTLGIQKPEVIAPSIELPAPLLPSTTQAHAASVLCCLDAMDDDLLRSHGAAIARDSGMVNDAEALISTDSLRSWIHRTIDDHQLITRWYKIVDGTSFAAPIVASIVAQMLELDPDLDPKSVKEILLDTASPLSDVPQERQGYGVVQQAEVLEVVRARMRRNFGA